MAIQHHWSAGLAGYSIGLGWGLGVKTYSRHHSIWAGLPEPDGRTGVGLALPLHVDGYGGERWRASSPRVNLRFSGA
jgi:hypothetical protein